MFLKQKETVHAIETLKAFEKKDTKVQSTAATNLSFIYFLVSVNDYVEFVLQVVIY